MTLQDTDPHKRIPIKKKGSLDNFEYGNRTKNFIVLCGRDNKVIENRRSYRLESVCRDPIRGAAGKRSRMYLPRPPTPDLLSNEQKKKITAAAKN